VGVLQHFLDRYERPPVVVGATGTPARPVGTPVFAGRRDARRLCGAQQLLHSPIEARDMIATLPCGDATLLSHKGVGASRPSRRTRGCHGPGRCAGRADHDRGGRLVRVEKMLQDTHRTCAPRATRVSMRTAVVGMVMCSDPAIGRRPAAGLPRIPGGSPSGPASHVRQADLVPANSASDRSATANSMPLTR